MAEGDPVGWAEPIPFAEVKSRLGVRNDHRDQEIARLTKTARERVEEMSYRALSRRPFSVTRRNMTVGQAIASVPQRPFVELVGVRMSNGGAFVDLLTLPEVVRIDDAIDVVGLDDLAAGSWSYVQVDYVAGYGPGGEGEPEGEPVLEKLIQAMLLLVGHWFENHEGVVVGTIAGKLPHGVEDLCQGSRPPGVIA